ncbi:MAG: pentapeptide repeat-containing protein, partial [Candidatus Azambacteria bacterium]|nr:pentapeptide repeat-containing protein [Candidatus Azambacteria bacterium]
GGWVGGGRLFDWVISNSELPQSAPSRQLTAHRDSSKALERNSGNTYLMTPESAQTIAAYLSLAVPATVAIANFAKIAMEWLQQRHKIGEAQIQLSHQITTHYLDRALDPVVPLAIRHQLLRFLATPDVKGARLSTWARTELERVGGQVDETNRAVVVAEEGLRAAKSAVELDRAERKLAEAVRKQRSLLEPPTTPPVSAAAIRAGLVDAKKLNGLEMPNADLRNSSFVYRELRGANFKNTDLTATSLQGCDLRAADMSGAILDHTTLYLADLRGANLSNVKMNSCDLRQARLEGADLRGAQIADCRVLATFDESTQWPDGFDALAAGAVHTGPEGVAAATVNLSQ